MEKKVALMIWSLALLVSCKTTVTTKDNCGDGFLDPGEACDGAAFGGVSCESLGYYRIEGQVVCTSACELNITDCGLARCGDGTIQTGDGEQCEGENLGGGSCVQLGYETGTLSCASDCHYDLSGCVAAGDCGNGEVQDGEQCDGVDLEGQTCQTLGYHGGNLLCTEGCQLDTSDCVAIGRCGDGRIQADYGEECDGANLQQQSCLTLEFYGGMLSCDENCHFDLSSCEAAGTCGDGQIQAEEEECDETNLGGETCQTLGWYGGTLTCSLCTFNWTPCEAAGRCGDGEIQAGQGETCDGVNLDGDTCETLGYYDGDITCTDQCLQDRTACEAAGRCGDGLIQSGHGETCDGTNLGGQTCASIGFWGGALGCNACAVIDTGCVTLDKISAGEAHTCALDSMGAAWCWGSRYSGALGDGQSSGSSNIPVAVTVTPGITYTAIASGANFSCAITTSGTARCWGANTQGQLGNSDSQPRATPTSVTMPAGKSFSRISAGIHHACALTTGGEVYCWGYNYQGRVGDGTEETRYVPVPINSALTFTTLVVGPMHSCALTATGELYCWGVNGFNQISEADTNPVLSPVAVAIPGGQGVTDVSLGYYHTCVVTDGAVAVNLYCKGQNSQGQLGYATAGAPSSTFQMVGFGSGTVIADVMAGYAFTCSMNALGEIFCWGYNQEGQLGRGAPSTGSSAPERVLTVPFNKTFRAFEAGDSHTCVRDLDDRPWCWGKNEFGQLGEGTFIDSPIPMSVWSI